MATKKALYRIAFLNQGRLYEVYARQVSHGGMLGFVEIEGLIFGAEGKIVVDPSQEQLEKEFAGVKRCFVPLHAVVRIDEVEKQGPARILEASGSSSNLAPFPLPIVRPETPPSKS